MLEFSVQVSGIDFSSPNFEPNALAGGLRKTICEAEVVYRPKFHAEVADRLNTRSGPV